MPRATSLDSSPVYPGASLVGGLAGGCAWQSGQVFETGFSVCNFVWATYLSTGIPIGAPVSSPDISSWIIATDAKPFTRCDIVLDTAAVAVPVVLDVLKSGDWGTTWTSLWHDVGSKPTIAVGQTRCVVTAFDACIEAGDLVAMGWVSGACEAITSLTYSSGGASGQTWQYYTALPILVATMTLR